MKKLPFLITLFSLGMAMCVLPSYVLHKTTQDKSSDDQPVITLNVQQITLLWVEKMQNPKFGHMVSVIHIIFPSIKFLNNYLPARLVRIPGRRLI